MFRTRQAPSPTGYLHFGTARQILYTILFAKINDGTWFLRLEDTDRSRLQPEAANAMLDTLDKMGMNNPEGITLEENGKPDYFYSIYQKGALGPYIQSERLQKYHEAAQELVEKKLAYWSYLSDEEKNELQAIKSATKNPIDYYKANLDRYGEDMMSKPIFEALEDKRKPSLRYRMMRDGKVKCKDLLVGDTEFDLSLEEDFNILKSDGYPTYHLAHLVDDHEMETSLVIRAQEWYPSIARHVTMFMDYWGASPDYIHIPFILGSTGNKKMSKRDGNVRIEDYLEQGFLPEAIINYLAFLGWNPGTDKELYLEPQDFELSQEERITKLINNIAEDFSVDTLSKSPARFDLDKMTWFNREYIKMLRLSEFADLACNLRIKPINNKTPDEYDENEYYNNNGETATDIDNKKLRICDLIILHDEKENLVYCENAQKKPSDNKELVKLGHIKGLDSYLHPVGGGREWGLELKKNLQKEANEETNSQLNLNFDLIKEVGSYKIINGEFEMQVGKYDGKIFNTHYLKINSKELEAFQEDENGHFQHFEWQPLPEMIDNNQALTYPVWKKFCENNNIKCYEPTETTQLSYLGWYLDKQRVELLSDLDLESNTVRRWARPSEEDIKWKKITLEESLSCLRALRDEVIKPFYNNPEAASVLESQQEMYNLTTNQDTSIDVIDAKFNEIASVWETVIKDWINTGDKDTGSHLWPLRVALTGRKRSASPFELLAILKPEETLKRINTCLQTTEIPKSDSTQANTQTDPAKEIDPEPKQIAEELPTEEPKPKVDEIAIKSKKTIIGGGSK